MSRYNSKKRGLQRLLLIQRDGNKCVFCGVEGFEKPFLQKNGKYDLGLIKKERESEREKPARHVLDLHHDCKEPNCETPSHWMLACHRCNCKHRDSTHHIAEDLGLNSGHEEVCVSVSESEESSQYSESVSTGRPATPETMRNIMLTRNWVPYLVFMIEGKNPEVMKIVNGFRAFMKKEHGRDWGSSVTAKRYIDETCDFEGQDTHLKEFKIVSQPNGTEVVQYANDVVAEKYSPTFRKRKKPSSISEALKEE